MVMCNYNKQNQTVLADGECLPTNVDWFGWDFYAGDSTSWSTVREAYETQVYPRFSRSGQRAVPVSLGSTGSLTAAQAETFDAFCSLNAREFLRFGLEDPRVVALFPFYWDAGAVVHKNGSITGSTGIKQLTNCRATYEAIGRMILASGPKGTSGLDPAPNPPSPDAAGNFVEPKCNTPTRPPPGIWPWCDRHNNPSSAAPTVVRVRRPH